MNSRLGSNSARMTASFVDAAIYYTYLKLISLYASAYVYITLGYIDNRKQTRSCTKSDEGKNTRRIENWPS